MRIMFGLTYSTTLAKASYFYELFTPRMLELSSKIYSNRGNSSPEWFNSRLSLCSKSSVAIILVVMLRRLTSLDQFVRLPSIQRIGQVCLVTLPCSMSQTHYFSCFCCSMPYLLTSYYLLGLRLWLSTFSRCLQDILVLSTADCTVSATVVLEIYWRDNAKLAVRGLYQDFPLQITVKGPVFCYTTSVILLCPTVGPSTTSTRLHVSYWQSPLALLLLLSMVGFLLSLNYIFIVRSI